MPALIIGVAAAGFTAGWLLALPAYRLTVPAPEPPRDACENCGYELRYGVSGWVTWQARCAGCRTRLGPRAGWLALTAAAGCGVLAWALGPSMVLVAFVALTLLAVLLGVIDLGCRRLPDLLVLPALWVSALLLTVFTVVGGTRAELARATAGAVLLGGVFLLLAILPGGGLGLGDVKLAVLLGLYLGWLGWPAVVLGGLLPWLLNAPIVIFLLLSGAVERKSRLPFGPAMLAGALLAVLGWSWLR